VRPRLARYLPIRRVRLHKHSILTGQERVAGINGGQK